MSNNENTVVELFAGVGGFRLGLEAEGWNTIFANQWEPGKKLQWAFDCYNSHFNDSNNSNKDISTVDSKDIPDHTLLCGGFPCQDYSVAATLVNSKGIIGKKGILWWDIRRIVEDKKPKFILLENVDRLLKSPASQRGRDFSIILSCLNSLGYSVEWRVINAADFGFGQRRRRTFIFATKDKKIQNKLYGGFKDEAVLTKTGLFASSFACTKEPTLPIKTFNIPTDLVQLSDTFSALFENSGYCINYICKSAKVSPLYTGPLKTLGQVLESHVDEKYYIKEGELDKWAYLKGGKKELRVAKNGHEYQYSEGPIAYPDYLDRPSRTMLTSESSKSRMSHVIEDPETKKYRVLTPLECERLNGFPDNWTNTGMPEKFRYFCMGNALVVDVIKVLGKAILKLNS